MPLENESARKIDQNGYINIERNPISRSGIFQYLGKSIGAPEEDRIYNVYRPDEELSSLEAIESFKLIPLIDDHAMLGSEMDGLLPPEQKGIHGTTGDELTFENGVLYANLKIFSNFLADMINQGKKDLSLGYRCVYEKVSGFFNGEPYDYVQRQMRGNHIALVDEARCGVSVLDQHMAFDHFDLALDFKEFKNMADKENDKEDGEKGEKKEMTLSEVVSMLEDIMPKIDALIKAKSGSGEEDVGEGEAAVDADMECKGAKDEDMEKEEKKEDKAKDSKAKDEDYDGMDAAIKKLANDVHSLKNSGIKSLLKEVTQRDSLAGKLSVHIGTFDHSDKTLNEVAEYGVKKLGLSCPKGQEITILNGFLHNRGASNTGFTLDSKAASKGGKLQSFLAKKSA